MNFCVLKVRCLYSHQTTNASLVGPLVRGRGRRVGRDVQEAREPSRGQEGGGAG